MNTEKRFSITKLASLFSSGALIAVLIAIGSSWWTFHLMKTEAEDREQAVALLLKEEIESNITILKTNDEWIDFDLQSIPERKSLIKPLITLESSAIDILRIQIPQKYFGKGKAVLKALHLVLIKVKHYNSMIAVRENHRSHLGQLSNYGELLENYDRTLKVEGLELLEQLQALLHLL